METTAQFNPDDSLIKATKSRVVAKKRRLFNQPIGFVLAILGLVMLWRFSPVSLVTVVLLAVAVLFLFGLKRPAWAMAALLASELTLTSYMVNTPFGFTISLRLLLLVLIALLLWHSLAQKEVTLGPGARRVLIPVLIFFGLSVVANLVGSGFSETFSNFRNLGVGVLIIVFLPLMVRNLEDLRILCLVVFIGMTVSSVIAIMQHYQILGMGEATLIPGAITAEEGRVPGISEGALYLSFTLPVAALALLGTFLTKGNNTGTKWLLGASFLLMGLALYFTYTRSALLALGFGLLALPLFLKTRIKWSTTIVAFLLIILLIEMTGVMESQFLGGRGQAEQESSTYERKVLWQAGMAIALDNPILGIGAGQFRAVSPQYTSSVDPELIRIQETYWEYRTLGGQDPHNDFLMVWVSYGTPALVVYLWILIAVLQNLYHAYRKSNQRFIKGLSIGLAAGLIAYIANAFFHNCIAAMPLFWILAGFSIATVKLALTRNNTSHLDNRGLKHQVSRT
jgi:O-antigen ligase